MARSPYPGELESCPWGITPSPSREYVMALACCGNCQEAGFVQDGHFACSCQADRLLAKGWREEARELNGQWEAVLSREVA